MEKSYVISVSFQTGCYRHLRIAQNATLLQLDQAIEKAFHLSTRLMHAFFMDNDSRNYEGAYLCPDFHGCGFKPGNITNRVALRQLGLTVGKKFKLLLTGDVERMFQCKVLRCLDEPTPEPVLLRSVGELPEPEPQEDTMILPDIYTDEVLNRMRSELQLSGHTVDTLLAYFAAAANLYGIMPLTDLLKLYNSQNPPISQEDFLAVVEIARHSPVYYGIFGEEALFADAPTALPMEQRVIHESLYMVDVSYYLEIQAGHQNNSFYIIPKEQFLRYADDRYYERTIQVAAMERYLRKKHRFSAKVTREILLTLVSAIRCEMDMEFVMSQMDIFGYEPDNDADFNKFLQLYSDLNNTTRLQFLAGHTPAEAFTEKLSQRPVTFSDPPDPGNIIQLLSKHKLTN